MTRWRRLHLLLVLGLGAFPAAESARLVGSRVVVKMDPLGDAIEILAGADRVTEHVQVPKGQRSIHEELVAALRRPRFEGGSARKDQVLQSCHAASILIGRKGSNSVNQGEPTSGAAL